MGDTRTSECDDMDIKPTTPKWNGPCGDGINQPLTLVIVKLRHPRAQIDVALALNEIIQGK